MLPAFAPIPDLGWAVLIERPVSEAYAPLYASTLRTALILLVGLGMAVFASLVLGRRVVGPIEILRRGAARIGSGDLDHRLEIKTGDELQELADEFNNMTGQLQESYANLEHKVEDRTRELTESLEQQTATAVILGVIASSPTDVQPVLYTVIEYAGLMASSSKSSPITVKLLNRSLSSSPNPSDLFRRPDLVGQFLRESPSWYLMRKSVPTRTRPRFWPGLERF